MNRCRVGHESEEADYCSVCGVAMGGAAPGQGMPRGASSPGAPGAIAGGAVHHANAAASASPASLSAHVFCPDCGEERAASARFCEVCRFDFITGTGASPQAHAVAAAASAPAAASPAAPAERPPSARPPAVTNGQESSNGQLNVALFELVVAADPALDTEPDADTPKAASETVVPLVGAELLVGRRDDRRDIHPDIAVDDPGASRRHAKFVRQVDGSIALQDLASTNGTKINDVDVKPGTRQTLGVGDAVTLGRWTRITLRYGAKAGVS